MSESRCSCCGRDRIDEMRKNPFRSDEEKKKMMSQVVKSFEMEVD